MNAHAVLPFQTERYVAATTARSLFRFSGWDAGDIGEWEMRGWMRCRSGGVVHLFPLYVSYAMAFPCSRGCPGYVPGSLPMAIRSDFPVAFDDNDAVLAPLSRSGRGREGVEMGQGLSLIHI